MTDGFLVGVGFLNLGEVEEADEDLGEVRECERERYGDLIGS